MDVKFSGTLTAADYIDAYRLHQNWRSLVPISVFFFVIYAILLYSNNDPHWFTTALILWGLLFSLMLGLRAIRLPFRARKAYGQQESAHLSYQMEITEAEFISSSAIGNARIPWKTLHKWKANDRTILVYHSDSMFQMLPRRFFASDEDYAALQATLTREIGPMGKPRRR